MQSGPIAIIASFSGEIEPTIRRDHVSGPVTDIIKFTQMTDGVEKVRFRFALRSVEVRVRPS